MLLLVLCTKVLLIMLHLCHVQTARFRQFWDEAAKSRHILEVVPGIWSYPLLIFWFPACKITTGSYVPPDVLIYSTCFWNHSCEARTVIT